MPMPTAHSRLLRLVMALLGLMVVVGAGAHDPRRRFADHVVDRWGLEEGLPQISVTSITQDTSGYLWVGTQNGIARFDGMRFAPYARRDTGGHGVYMVRDSLRDRTGRLWFGTEHGLLSYDGTRFTAHMDPGAATLVRSLAERSDGVVLVGTPSGLFAIDGGALRPAGLDGRDIGALLATADGPVFAGARGEVHALHAIEEGPIRLDGAPDARVAALALDGDRLWIGTDQGLFHRDGESATAQRMAGAVGEATVLSLLVDRSGSLWIGTDEALFTEDADGSFAPHGGEDFVAHPWVTALFQDRDGNIWIGSENESLFRLWGGWVSRIDERAGLGEPLVWSLAHDAGGALVMGTNDGIYRMEDGRIDLLVDGDQLPNPVAYELDFDARGRLWVGTRAGLARVESAGTPPIALPEFGDAQVNAVVDDGEGGVWIGSSNGAWHWRDDRLQRLDSADGGPRSRVRSVLPREDGTVLLGTEGGLLAWRAEGLTTPEWARSLDRAFVTSIEALAPDLLLVTTLDDGFGIVIDGRLRRVETALGQPLANLWGARVVDAQVYLSSSDGVFSIPLAQLRAHWADPMAALDWRVPVSTSGTRRGSLRSRCCNGGARSRALVDGDRILYPTLSGTLVLELDRLDGSVETPRAVVESVQHAGHVHLPAGDGVVEIDRDSRDLAVDYTAFAYRDPRGIHFHYRLDGYDASWVAAGPRRTAYYTNLPPGEYTFRVRAESAAGVSSPEDAVLRLHLLPRWYERAGVRAAAVVLALIALIALSGVVVRRRTEEMAQRQEALQSLVDLRTLELAHANERLQNANRALAQENITDALTGMPNRRWMQVHLGEWLRERETAGPTGSCTVFALFDLDRFALLRERYGHVGADRLVRQFAAGLKRHAGAGAQVVRWTGEAFLVLLPGVPRASAGERVSALWQEISQQLHQGPDDEPRMLACTAGYALHPPVESEGDALPWSVSVELADAAAFLLRRSPAPRCGGLVAAPGVPASALDHGLPGSIAERLEDGTLRWDRAPTA
jgi:diguanylate cyclase (GGDEF)-like protein